jgi:hypothetical protein
MKKPTYIISESNNEFFINGIKINQRIFDEEIVDFDIREIEEFTDNLIQWISEGNKDKQLMKDDLKILMNIDDEDYILSSKSTNLYLFGNSDAFNTKCQEMIDASLNLDNDKVIVLNTDNGHDQQIVNAFNRVAKHFDNYGLLEIILVNYFDDQDLEGLTIHLKNRLEENDIEF